jgi:hypothetical protein
VRQLFTYLLPPFRVFCVAGHAAKFRPQPLPREVGHVAPLLNPERGHFLVLAGGGIGPKANSLWTRGSLNFSSVTNNLPEVNGLLQVGGWSHAFV